MTLTTVPTVATGDIHTAAQWNTYVRDNVNDLINMVNGTNPFSGTTQKFGNDSNFSAKILSSQPYFSFDSNDYITYDRTNNYWQLAIGSTMKLQVDGNGKLTGAGIYAGGETTITNTSTATFAHGLGAIPRWFQLRYSAGSGGTKSNVGINSTIVGAASEVRISTVDATNVTVANNTGSTQYCVVDVIL